MDQKEQIKDQTTSLTNDKEILKKLNEVFTSFGIKDFVLCFQNPLTKVFISHGNGLIQDKKYLADYQQSIITREYNEFIQKITVRSSFID